MNKIEELENKALALVQEIAELKKSQNTGEWKPNEGEQYWFMGLNGEPDQTMFSVFSNYDDWRVKNLPVFETEEECQKYCDYRKALIEKSYKFSREEWEDDNISKFCIVYNHNDKTYHVSSWYSTHWIGMCKFKTQEDAEYMIDNYSDEMLKWGF